YALDLTVTPAIGIGDLLRLTFADNRTLSFPVTGLEPGISSPPAGAGQVQDLRLTSQKPLWNLLSASVEKLGEQGWEPLLSPPGQAQDLPLLEAQLGRFSEYRLYLPINAPVQVGDLLRVTCADQTVLFFPVAGVDTQQSASSPPEAGQAQDLPLLRLVSTEPLWWLQQPASPPTAFRQLIEVDLLSFDLFIREGGLVQERWLEQRFSARPNYWGQTLADQSKYLQAPVDALDPNTAPLYLPLGMSDLPAPGEFSRALPDDTQFASPPVPLSHKDGLDTFDPVALFLDPRFADIGVRDLINEANQYLYLDPGGHVEPLKKLHSLLEIEEVGLIALPDAVHRPWGPPEGLPDTEVKPPEPPPPDWSHFHNCPVPPPPADGAKQLCLQPFVFNPLDDTEEIPDVRQQLALLPVLTPASFYQMDQLLAVQKALVVLCAARADVVAILSLPEHFARREALDWQQALLGETVNTDDLNMLSYVAAYHPWLQIPEPVTPALAPLRAVPPDGACCGMIAARELVRGPWIAPANVPLRGVVALTPDLTKADWAALFDARVNLVRQLPGQFTLLSSHTLSYDDQLVQISVRRLLIFLRKLALRRGMRYVFETNNERFRQRVQASFESTLNALVARGGISAFEVVTDESINTPNDFANGRFLIALKVAPTLPIEFITVILLRSGEDLLNVIER
ncbi:MAG: phage tail sheath C-terminal domain-containing protein, partial [Ktedonobacteraceae bacterium]